MLLKREACVRVEAKRLQHIQLQSWEGCNEVRYWTSVCRSVMDDGISMVALLVLTVVLSVSATKRCDMTFCMA